MGYVKLIENDANRHESQATEFILERDPDTGAVTKTVRMGVPVDLSKEEQTMLEEVGAKFEKSSADEHKEFEEEAQGAVEVPSDVQGSGPIFGSSDSKPNQSVDSTVAVETTNVGAKKATDQTS